MKVGIEKTDPAGGQPTLALVPAQRPILIQDLMRHTSGLTYGFFGNLLVKKAYVDAGITKGDFDNAEFADRLAKLPLAFQPGTTWDYSHSTDILDTSFYVTDGSKQNRIAEPFKADRVLGAAAEMNNPRIVGKWESGGGGMCGTTTDYARFLRMLLSGGILDGKRYLGPKTISYMTADHMGNVIVPGPYYLPGPGYGFGLGFAVRKEQGVSPAMGSPGDYYWGGVGGTVDKFQGQEAAVVIVSMTTSKAGDAVRGLLAKFHCLVSRVGYCS